MEDVFILSMDTMELPDYDQMSRITLKIFTDYFMLFYA